MYKRQGYLWPDSDNDGIPDIWEQAYGMNPEDPTDANQISINVDPVSYTHLDVYKRQELYRLISESIHRQNS